jgi:YVTN family beta-propeller protein
MKFSIAGVFVLAAALAGCGSGSSSPVRLTISTGSSFGQPVGHTTVVRTGTQQFSASVVGIQNTLVTWDVCDAAPQAIATGVSNAPNIVMPTGCVTGGNSTLGSITTAGLYTGPATLPPNSEVSVVAIAQGKTSVFAITDVTIDSGVRVSLSPTGVTIGTSEQFQFSATVTGDTNTAVSWAVNSVANGTTQTGTITPTACTVSMPVTPSSSNPVPQGTSFGCYTAPATPQTGVKITATAAADTSQVGTATVNVQTATDPSFRTNIPLEPTATVEGAARQDIYLFGSNFFSTTQVLVNGSPVSTTFVNNATLRATIPGTFFSGPVPAGLPVTVERQNGDVIQPVSLGVQPTRPAAVAASPQSLPTATSSGTLTIDGGYFSSSTQASSEGQPLPVTVVNSRQLQVGLSSPAFSFSTPGLVPILIQNSDVPSGSPSTAFVNVAISPSAADIPTSANPPIAVGTQPVAVALDTSLGIAAVLDQGSGSAGAVSLLNVDSNSVSGTLPVGNSPTSIGVDDILHVAAVVNSADNSLSIVNLQTQGVSTVALPSNPTGSSPSPSPFAIGVNPLTHRAVIAYASSNIATVFDLSTNPPSLVCTMGGSNPNMPNNCSTISGSNTRPVSTGPSPSIAIEPQLNWAIITPGGSGITSIVDLGTAATANQVARVPNVIASFSTGSTSIRGASINTETEQALLTDPNCGLGSPSCRASVTLLSVLDQTVNSLTLSQGYVASAVNPLTDVGVAVNGPANTATVIDLRTLTQIASVPVGTSPQAVAIDPGKNIAVIANSGSNDVSILSLGAIRSPQITEVSPPIAFAAPSAGAQVVTVNGFGFSSGAQVRLDGVVVPTTISANGRQAVATVPGSMLSAARRFALDVQNSTGATSNVKSFLVMGAVPIGLNPISVAIDLDLNEALVTSQGPINSPTNTCTTPGSVSVVDLAGAAVTNTLGVGACPQGVAVIPRLGLGVIANTDSANATVVDYVNGVVTSTVSTGLDPVGVAIGPDTGEALVTNSSSNSVTAFTVSSSSTAGGSIPVDQVPFGVAIDSIDNIAAVAASSQNTVDTITLGTSFITGRVSNFQGPTDVAFDPITDTFLVADSLANQIGIVDPKAPGIAGFTPFRVGINPTSLDYNFQSGTGVTFNAASNSFSIFNFVATNPNSHLTIQNAKVEFVLPIGGSAAFSVAINPLTNVAAVVDQANGRLLLVPLP